MRHRELTLEYLNERHCSDEVKIIERLQNPNKALVYFNKCGHIKEINFHSMRPQVKVRCEVCFDNDLKVECEKQDKLYLTKLEYGESKSKGEYRLCSCKFCGNFIFFLPQSMRNGNVRCMLCLKNKQTERCRELGYELISKQRQDENSGAYLLDIRCKVCGDITRVQQTNLMRSTVKCSSCSKKNVLKSYCYIFEILFGNNKYVKLGKSNNPYLRHLSFSDNPDVEFIFVEQLEFATEIEAFQFETYLKNKYSHFNIPKEKAKTFIKSGFSEIYSQYSLMYFRKEFNGFK